VPENNPTLVRDAVETDLEKIREIYSHYVLYGLATFEEAPPAVEELLARMNSIRFHGHPYLVATIDERVVGYAYAAPYRSRPAYRFTVEDSVYVEQGQHGKGIGTALLSCLISRCEEGSWRQMVAIIGDSGNAGSIALHRRMGFEEVGTLKAVGFKFDRWVDTVIMQRRLRLVNGPVLNLEHNMANK
jgi:L-amino acid N-acyltransferase YncA